jgi:hypothetical protein
MRRLGRANLTRLDAHSDHADRRPRGTQFDNIACGGLQNCGYRHPLRRLANSGLVPFARTASESTQGRHRTTFNHLPNPLEAGEYKLMFDRAAVRKARSAPPCRTPSRQLLSRIVPTEAAASQEGNRAFVPSISLARSVPTRRSPVPAANLGLWTLPPRYRVTIAAELGASFDALHLTHCAVSLAGRRLPRRCRSLFRSRLRRNQLRLSC